MAYRVALEANARSARRRRREAQGVEMDAVVDRRRDPDADLGPVIHEELRRLPEKYREPVVLCDLEGLTREQAADQLRWPVGTVSGRLARARELLRGRLARRGVALSGALAGPWLADRATAAVPAAWAEAATEAAMAVAKGAGAVPVAASALARDVARRMTMARVTRTAGGLLAMAATVGAVFAIADDAMKGKAKRPDAAKETRAAAVREGGPRRGRSRSGGGLSTRPARPSARRGSTSRLPRRSTRFSRRLSPWRAAAPTARSDSRSARRISPRAGLSPRWPRASGPAGSPSMPPAPPVS